MIFKYRFYLSDWQNIESMITSRVAVKDSGEQDVFLLRQGKEIKEKGCRLPDGRCSSKGPGLGSLRGRGT